ncbi:hypothetical protein [Bosea sp. PAMC 26642]|uniref:hypothetical protein n=1 Tax=Bosea sp. (strain PAMC 26642) TaxID=1792307 RepID=UPI00077004D8|nr:hypothetical protein [Bosea sp. PAMC 26642]AMJ58967.1 hypothetical protein AXW83_00430 [Bosea sp. PAMC 26642]
MIDASFRRSPLLALPFLCLGLAGCGSSSSSSGQPSTMRTFANVVMFQSTTPPPAEQLPKDEDNTFICPEVIIADGGAAIRAQGGPDSSSLRNQISILNFARECIAPTPAGGFNLKVGVEGRVLLGPAGTPGAYYGTLTTQVLRGTTVVARRASRVGGTVSSGQGGTDFSHVEDGIVVPPGRGEIEIIISLSSGGGAAPARSRRR